MQTFLPHSDFVKSARVLDTKRLGKQRIDNIQIMKALLLGGLENDPVVKMWRGYESWLMAYQSTVCREWTLERGREDIFFNATQTLYLLHRTAYQTEIEPPWLGLPVLHRSHRSSLIREFPEWYTNKFRGTPNDLSVFWPVD